MIQMGPVEKKIDRIKISLATILKLQKGTNLGLERF